MTDKALTVRQPWASAIMRTDARRKNVENRTWATRLRNERIAIHAGANIDRLALAIVTDPNITDLGVILGTVIVDGCHKQGSLECAYNDCRNNPWAQFSDNPVRPIWHWLVSEPRSFVTPIRAKGALQLWEPSPGVAYLMEIGDYK